ncbi:MAG: Mur ligase domain-containing protein [Caldilineaceae bacterium]
MRPVIHAHITQHTVWQALVGDTPPLSLPATPIVKAVLDNRDAAAGDLFVALVGENTDGHRYIGHALQAGASVIICEAHGAEVAQAHKALILDCGQSVAELRAILDQTDAPLAAAGLCCAE